MTSLGRATGLGGPQLKDAWQRQPSPETKKPWCCHVGAFGCPIISTSNPGRLALVTVLPGWRVVPSRLVQISGDSNYQGIFRRCYILQQRFNLACTAKNAHPRIRGFFEHQLLFRT
jgi:hypothetical protein